MISIRRAAACVSVALLLAGCSGSPPKEVQLVKEPDSLTELRTVSVIAAERLRDIQMAMQAERQRLTEEQRRQEAFNATYIPEGFETRGGMDTENWPDAICQQLAIMAGYDSPVLLGDRPKAPLLVRIQKHNVPLWEMVQELGLRTGKAFTMEVHENARMVRCVYNRPMSS